MKTNQVYLIHIRDCLARIEDYTREGKEFFLKDLKTQDAVIRNLEVMAESIKKLPDEWKRDFKEISWGEITGFRNRLAHE